MYLDKERRADNSRQHKADGYIPIRAEPYGRRAMTPQWGEREPPGREAGKAARGPGCADGAILPCSHSPSVQPYSGGEASQAMSRAA